MILVCIEDGKSSNLTSDMSRYSGIFGGPFFLKKFELYECDEDSWESNSSGILIKDNNGVKFWYSKLFFKPLNDIRNEKILNIIGD